MVTLGSKEGFANLAMAITSPGDVALVPNPSYPIHAYGFIIAGGTIRHILVGPKATLSVELKRAVLHSVPPPLALVLNFPSNPTAQVVTKEFYKEVVQFCLKTVIYILSDLAYAEIFFDEIPPPSILKIPEEKSIAVEFTSLRKTFSIPGWRIGFASGNSRLINALGRIKSFLDYGAFMPVQVAATAALNGSNDLIEAVRNTYRRRRDVLVESF